MQRDGARPPRTALTRLNESTPTDGFSDRHSPPALHSDISDHPVSVACTTQKVLLSIVNPWDVTVASVNPVGLASRRGVSLSTLPSSRDEGVSQEWPTLNRPVKVPSPWYKPGSGSSGHVNSVKSEEEALIKSTWLNSGYSPQR